MSELVALELGTVAHLELVNPPLNLITHEVLDAVAEALEVLARAAPGDVRAVVSSGSTEHAFSAGSTVAEFEPQRGPAGRARFELEERVAAELARLPMPT